MKHPIGCAAARPLVGMIHLLPLPGAPRYAGDLGAVQERMLRDAEALAEGGADALMVENFGDAPFFPGRVPAPVVSHLTALAVEVRRRFDLPLGINVLRNDGVAALAVAHAVGARFIRVNVLTGARVTDQGIIQGIAHELLRERARLGALEVAVLADVDVKHSAPLVPRPIAEEVRETLERGGADAVIVSGSATGHATDPGTVRVAAEAAGSAPVLVGSGVTAKTLADFLPWAGGFIVGTSLKQGADVNAPVDAARVRALRVLLD
jgi:membrane complex biogenesis BtpA family protein